MGLLITMCHFDLLKFDNDILSFLRIDDDNCDNISSSKRRFVDDPNELINNARSSQNYKFEIVQDRQHIDINTNQRALLNALCNGKYWIIRCKSTVMGNFDVAFAHPRAITFSQIKS